MTEIVPVDVLPNQTLEIVFDTQRYRLRLHEINGNMAIDVVLNNVDIVRGMIVPASALLIQYRYLRGAGGDFAFITQDDQLPYYTEFGKTQFLVYYEPTELAA